MTPRPLWLPGLDSDPNVKQYLQKAYKEAKEEYLRLRIKGCDALSASDGAIKFYLKRVSHGIDSAATN